MDIDIIRKNYDHIKSNIISSCKKVGRNADAIKIVAVTKRVSTDVVNTLSQLGITDIGENRVQDALEKAKGITHKYNWHLIGHLQTNKVKKTLQLFSTIHSVDSQRLAEELQKEATKLNKIIDVFIEVNVSGEKTKQGVSPSEVGGLVNSIRNNYKNINLLGLMTMAPIVKNPKDVRPYFRRLRGLRDEAGLKHLSMGMTQDYAIAVEEGADYLRIGTAFFKGL